MEITKTSRKKTNGKVGHGDLDEPKRRNQYSLSKSIKENEKMVEEMQQQMIQLERKIREKKMYHEKAITTLKYNRRSSRWGWIQDDPYSYQLDCLKKMELDKITFANNAYRDKKTVTSFSSGKREINIHNLNHRMLHEAKSMDGERGLLMMMNPRKDDDSELSINQIGEEMRKLERWLKWRECYNNTGTMDREEIERKVKELEWEKHRGFVNAPCKASLWNSLPSSKVLRNQIQAMEIRDEEKRKKVLVRRKKIESKERKIKKADKEIKSMNKMMEMISKRKQRALETISLEKKKSLCVVVETLKPQFSN